MAGDPLAGLMCHHCGRDTHWTERDWQALGFPGHLPICWACHRPITFAPTNPRPNALDAAGGRHNPAQGHFEGERSETG